MYVRTVEKNQFGAHVVKLTSRQAMTVKTAVLALKISLYSFSTTFWEEGYTENIRINMKAREEYPVKGLGGLSRESAHMSAKFLEF